GGRLHPARARRPGALRPGPAAREPVPLLPDRPAGHDPPVRADGPGRRSVARGRRPARREQLARGVTVDRLTLTRAVLADRLANPPASPQPQPTPQPQPAPP